MNSSGVITIYFFTISVLCHVEVTFVQLLNLLERYYVYLQYIFAESIQVIKSYKLLIDCCIHKVTYIRLLSLLKYTMSIYITYLKRLCLSHF